MVFPSIQSFYQKEIPAAPSPGTIQVQSKARSQSDGFSPAEVEAVLHPLTQTWKPHGEYEQVNIGNLQLGPCKVRFKGRLVNFVPAEEKPSRRALLPQGFHFLVVKDDTGIVVVSLSSHT
jgi:hypothetical protein